MLDDVQVICPYCGEAIWLTVDMSAGAQAYTEDCSVCCNPMLVQLAVAEDGGSAAVRVEREND